MGKKDEKVLFGNPERDRSSISRYGKFLAETTELSIDSKRF